MAWETLKEAVAAVIKTNGTGAITGQVLQDIINTNLIPQLGKDRYKGVAVPATAPGTPQNEEYYFAYTAGIYANFGGLVLKDGFSVLIYNAGVWSKQEIDFTGFASKKSLLKSNLQNRNISESDTLLEKFRLCNLDFDNPVYADGSNLSGIKPINGNTFIWASDTDGFLTLPILDFSKQTSKHLGVIFEGNIILNKSNYFSFDAYLVKDGSYLGFAKIKETVLDGKLVYYGSFDLTSVTTFTTLGLGLIFHTTPDSNTVAMEFSNVKLFYIDDDTVDGMFTLRDYLDKKFSPLNRMLAVEQNKVEQIHSNNYLNPETFRYGNFYWAGQNPELASNPGYGCTDYIYARPEGLITTGAGLAAQGLSSYAVFDLNKVWLRNGQDTNQYNYVAGDGFVVFVYAWVGAEFALTKAVCVGTSYTFNPYYEHLPIYTLENKVFALENKLVSVEKVSNGDPIVYGNVSNFAGTAISDRNIEEDSLVFNIAGEGNSWIITPEFIPKGSNLVHIRFSVEFTKVGTTAGFYLIVAEEESVGGKYINIGSQITEDGTYDVTFDPAYFSVYEGYTNFRVWINNHNISAGQTIAAKLINLEVVEYDNGVKGANIEGVTAKALFETTDLALTDIKSQLNDKAELISPLGNKFELNVSDIGTITAIPVIPFRGKFFGNSLIGGFGYGMAASEAQFDYYFRINTYIQTINPSYTASIGSGSGLLENATTEEELVTAINTMTASLIGDENLVCIQLGDNVNTTSKNLIFNQGNGCLRALQAIRIKCPNARVVWMGMWYGDTERYNTIINSCKATGSKFITFSDLISPASCNVVGNLTKKGTATRTLLNVTTVTENSPTDIHIVFTIGGDAVITNVPVSSYSLSGTTLTYTSEYEIIDNGGVASHPNDEGFRLIANRFLYQMKLSDNLETYV